MLFMMVVVVVLLLLLMMMMMTMMTMWLLFVALELYVSFSLSVFSYFLLSFHIFSQFGVIHLFMTESEFDLEFDPMSRFAAIQTYLLASRVSGGCGCGCGGGGDGDGAAGGVGADADGDAVILVMLAVVVFLS